jgi:hypothetical protein
VHWIFDIYANKDENTFYPSPMYLMGKDSRPICDGIVMCGSTAVLIESKLGTCAAEVRYSGDSPSALSSTGQISLARPIS